MYIASLVLSHSLRTALFAIIPGIRELLFVTTLNHFFPVFLSQVKAF